jgi:hypothetical protein
MPHVRFGQFVFSHPAVSTLKAIAPIFLDDAAMEKKLEQMDLSPPSPPVCH